MAAEDVGRKWEELSLLLCAGVQWPGVDIGDLEDLVHPIVQGPTGRWLGPATRGPAVAAA